MRLAVLARAVAATSTVSGSSTVTAVISRATSSTLAMFAAVGAGATIRRANAIACLGAIAGAIARAAACFVRHG